MKLSVLQIGFGVSVLTHGLVFSAAVLFHSYHRNASYDVAAGNSSQLEFVLVPDSAEASAPNVVGAHVRRLITESATPAPAPPTVTSAPKAPVIPEPLPVTPAQESAEPVTRPADPPAPEQQTVLDAPPPAADLLTASFFEQSNLVLASEGPQATKAISATGIPASSVGAMPGATAGAAYLFNPRPAYPPQARARNQQGKVIISVLVNAEGLAEQVEVRESSGVPSLDQAALEAVKSWRFTPARVQDRPIRSRVEVPVNFELTDSGYLQGKP